MQIEIDTLCLDVAEKTDEVLQRTTQSVDRPHGHQIEISSRDAFEQSIEARTLVAPLGAADALVGKLRDDVPVEPSRDLLKHSELVLGRLVRVRRHSEIEGDTLRHRVDDATDWQSVNKTGDYGTRRPGSRDARKTWILEARFRRGFWDTRPSRSPVARHGMSRITSWRPAPNAPTSPIMTWHVQYREGAADHIERFGGPELAIEAACRLIDEGRDVYGIGTGPLTDSIGKDEIAKIYAMWDRAKYPFGDRTYGP